MDVSKLLTAGEWLEIEGIEGFDEFGAFKLKIMPIDPLVYFDFQASARAIPSNISVPEISEKLTSLVSMVLSLVVDWNFESEGQKIDCSEKTKELYLRRIIWRKVKGKAVLLANAIINFAFNPESYSKNEKPISFGMRIGTR